MNLVLNALLLGTLYAVLVDVGDGLNWVIGFALGAAVPRAITLSSGGMRSLTRVPAFIWGLTWLTARGGLQTLRALVTGRTSRAGYIELAFPEGSQQRASALGFALTTSPGTALAALDRASRKLELHSIDAADPQRLREDVERFYRRYQAPAFERVGAPSPPARASGHDESPAEEDR